MFYNFRSGLLTFLVSAQVFSTPVTYTGIYFYSISSASYFFFLLYLLRGLARRIKIYNEACLQQTAYI